MKFYYEKHWIWRHAGYRLRCWAPARLLLFRVDRDDPQGDQLFTVTIHLLGVAFQYWRLS